MSRPLILVVDDDDDLRTMVCRILDLHGYDACEATHGQDAVRAIRCLKPAAVLLDIIMPELDGNGVIEMLQDDATPIIVLTGHVGELREDLRPQLVDVVMKPATSCEIVRSIERALADTGLGHAMNDTVPDPRAAVAPGPLDTAAGT